MPVPTQPKMTGSVRASSSVMPREAKRTSRAGHGGVHVHEPGLPGAGADDFSGLFVGQLHLGV